MNLFAKVYFFGYGEESDLIGFGSSDMCDDLSAQDRNHHSDNEKHLEKMAWEKPEFRQIGASEAKGDLLLGGEIIVLLS
jgi:hypothetical protein